MNMENKLNIAELLKDCPSGMELYSPIFGDVYLDEIRPYLAVVVRTSDKQKEEFLYDGRFGINGECMLFPSKENRDWSTFQRPFKEGDIAVTEKGHIHLLRTKDSSYCAYREEWKGLPPFDPTITTGVKVVRLATKEEKQKFFDIIKANGYKWNNETKTLEKLPKFKVGDKITNDTISITIGYIDDNYYYEIGKNTTTRISIKEQDNWKLDKFDITTLKTFKSKVLVRSSMDGLWKPAVFGFRNGYNDNAFYIVGGSCWKQCIPYLNNEHLCGTTNDCDEYYKTW